MKRALLIKSAIHSQARNQFELQQLHVLRTLRAACAEEGAGGDRGEGAAAERVGRVLMADWVVQHVGAVRQVMGPSGGS